MKFTEYKYQPENVILALADKKASLKEDKGIDDFLGNALKLYSEFLKKDKKRYRDFGVYWWTFKAVLKRGGYDFGELADSFMESEYSGKTDEITLVMADLFRRQNLTENFKYTNKWIVNEDGDYFTLKDDDMEI